jgi:hypothetical protein
MRTFEPLDISDMGKIHWFLNFEIKWDRAAQKIFINQKAYLPKSSTYKIANRLTCPLNPVKFYPTFSLHPHLPNNSKCDENLMLRRSDTLIIYTQHKPRNAPKASRMQR